MICKRHKFISQNLAIIFCLGSLIMIDQAGEVAPAIRFNRDVRPILSDNCFRCHGPELKSRKAKLRLDVRAVAVEKEAIVPGKPDESETIRRLTTTNLDDHMPPEEMHKVVTPAQIETLRKWIAAGAPYEPHWSYAPIKRPIVPEVKNFPAAVSPIDHFILARLEEQKIEPSPAADRRTLLRRLSLDLTGLPPTLAEVEAFVKDRSPGAYEKQVDRLLASQHYGERMAVPWLDAVRFADTVGYHGDQNQNVFPYRDYVIDAFNNDKPFDQFTREQIAGDLLPGATTEQKVASGFNRLGMVTREGGAQPKEYLAKYQADRVRTISTAWLGSTMACCECHDHKYDPFTAKDFYSLSAFFADVKQWGLYQDLVYTPNPELAGFGNHHPFPPEMVVSSPYLQHRQTKLMRAFTNQLAAVADEITADKTKQAALADWLKTTREFLRAQPDGWLTPPPQTFVFATNDQRLSPWTNVVVTSNGDVEFLGKFENAGQRAVRLTSGSGRVASIRLELSPRHLTLQEVARTEQRDGVVPSLWLQPAQGALRSLKIYYADANFKEPRYTSGDELPGVKGGWKIPLTNSAARLTSVWLLDSPVTLAEGDSLVMSFGGDMFAPMKLAVSPLAHIEPMQVADAPQLKLIQNPDGWRKKSLRLALATTFLLSTAFDTNAFSQFKQTRKEIMACRNGTTPMLVTVSTTNRLVTRVLPRGNWQDESGEILAPAVPHFLPQPKADGTNRLTRLDLARWLTSRENPLTARAFVNRLWKQLFGNGLSNQPEDLGAQGEWPSHPELLDWLAAEFMDSGWDVKHMVKLMVISATYQQDAKIRPELVELDPRNRLLARQNPRRLEAEFVRDNALAVAGLLNDEVGGPSVFPYQPVGYYANIQFPDRDYIASPDERQYRRGIYTHWQRTFLHPMLANFDAPSREECTVDRPASSTPQQALTLLNDPTFVEAARALAEKVLLAPKIKTDSARVNLAVETALLRPAKPAEIGSLLEFLKVQRDYYSANVTDAKKLLGVGLRPPATDLAAAEDAAWTSLARVLLNLQETITRY